MFNLLSDRGEDMHGYILKNIRLTKILHVNATTINK